MEDIRPISKSIYKNAKSLGIKTLTLQFEGGSDEGALEVWFDDHEIVNLKFEKQVYDWAWEVYQYDGDSGGLCGDFSDVITYDLKRNLTCSTYQRQVVRWDEEIEFEPTVAKKKKSV